MSLLSFRNRGDWLVAGFNVDRLTDPNTVQTATRELADRLERLPLRGQAVISFEGVEHASSQLIGLLLAARTIVVDERFGRLVLCRVSQHLSDMLRLTKLDAHFEMYARLRDLLAESGGEKSTWSKPMASATSGRANDPEWID
jgi:anti-anti-sigma regulatory factor